MKRNEKYTSMVIFLEHEEHGKLKEISFANGTFPHRVISEFVRHLNSHGMTRWLLRKCLSGQSESHKRSK